MVAVDKLLKSLANSRRLAILKYLQRTDRASVSDVARHIKLSFKATSKHLAILSNADVIEKQQEGLVMWHRLSKQKHPIVTEVLKH